MRQVKDIYYSSLTETKTLGLLWEPHPDSFAFKISPMTSIYENLIVTKKAVILYNHKNIRSDWTDWTCNNKS
ncbi:hypothetical protein TNCV_1022681 [Trichonephila clavipes]|nr:hypothetical protein TNCV_1022681 [Trichonephila clavipes]